MLAAAAATMPTQPTACVNPMDRTASQPGYTIYLTGAADTPYTLAKRFYGHSYMAYAIVDANKTLLTKEGVFPKGTKIVIPPPYTGIPVDVNRYKHPY
jgi:phage tail protein X